MQVDKAGRVWTPRERREAVLDEWERSGMPATRFAAHVGVKYSRLAAWVQKRRRAQAGQKAAQKPALAWVEAVVRTAAGGLCIELPGGARMEIADGAQARLAAEVLRALGGQQDTGATRERKIGC